MRRTVCRRPVATSSSEACCRLDSWTVEECLASLPATYLLTGLDFPCIVYQTGIFPMLSLCPFYTAHSRRERCTVISPHGSWKRLLRSVLLYGTHSQLRFSHGSFQLDQVETTLFNQSPSWFDINTDALGLWVESAAIRVGNETQKSTISLTRSFKSFYRPSTLVAEIKQC